MKRLIRPALFTLISISAAVAFVMLGRASPHPVTVDDLGGWLDQVEPVDALAEIARGIGLVLAIYVAAVSVTALASEVAALLRFARLHRWLARLAQSVAVPALRHRLLEVTTAATITASALQVSPAGATIAPTASATVVVDSIPSATDLPAIRGEFEGFDVPARGVPTSVEGDVHVVVEGDTLWDIVDRHYGRVDADLVGAVVRANPIIRDADLILVGWELQLPTIDTPAAESEESRPVEGEASWTVVTVRRGDTLWDIVDRHYGQATGDLVWKTVEANPDLESPDLIYAGQQITLPPPDARLGDQEPTTDQVDATPNAPPSLSTDPPAAIQAESPAAAVPPSAPTRSTPTESATTPWTTTAARPPAAPPGPVAEPALELPDVVSGDAEVRPIESEVVSEVDEIGDSPSLATILGWTGGAGLAAALVGLMARRRRRRAPADRHRTPPRDAIELDVALRSTENFTEAELAAEGLRQLAAQVRPRPGELTPVPRLLRVGTDDVELVWDVPNGEVVAPWSTSDGGWSWGLDCSAAKTDSRSKRPNPCPAFVTIGHRDASDVLLNLESCGAIAVIGDHDECNAVISALSLELAASTFADSPTVLLVGREQLPARPEHARVVSATEAAGWLRDRTESAAALLAQRRLTSLFALRARSRPEDSHEPVIVIVDAHSVDGVDLDSLVGLANGDLGAVVIVAGPHPSISWRLVCEGGDVSVEPLGLVLDELGMSDAFAELVDDVVPDAEVEDDFDMLDEPASDEVPIVLADHIVLARDRMPVLAPEIDPRDLPDGDVELKVLGQVGVEGLDEKLTPTELQLAIYLAFHRRGENGDTIATMVWPNGVAGKTVANNLAGLRRKLGPGANGEMLLPLRRETQDLYQLSPRVATDWERFVDLTRRANDAPDNEALRMLDEALALVNGPPFRARAGYSWAYSDGTASLIAETVALAARRCVDLHLERSEFAEAGEVARRASRSSDDPESNPLMARVEEAVARLGAERRQT